MSAWTQLIEPGPALLILALAVTSQVVSGAPFDDSGQSSEIEYYPVADATGCYYNFEHYDEGDRIITNEPCLNCTCHNRMLMCYLRVCPFTKAIGQNCKVEKKPDQCCPVITCPEVPVQLLPSDSTTPSTAVGHYGEYGCSIDNLFYADGAKVPSDPNNPCEVCYCIRNKTACIIQECTLTGEVVQGCRPVYVDGVCCPVRYDCDHPEIETTPRPLLTTTTTTLPPTSAPNDCIYNNEVYADGALVKKDVPCEKCYCMKGDIVCAVQECGPTPLDKVNCTALPRKEGQCCPDTYECENISEEDLTTLSYYEPPTTQPTEVLPVEGVISESEESLTTQSEEDGTEKQVTQSITQGTEGSSSVQPVTESATVESFTSRITEAVESITSKVTDIVEAFTTAISGTEQESTAQPETQTSEPETSLVTEKAQVSDQQTSTVGEIEKGTESELIVTEKTSYDTAAPEEHVIVTESATELSEIAHDDHEEELPHEEDNEIFEGSGKPVEEEATPSVTDAPGSEHTKKEKATTETIQGEFVTTEKAEEEVHAEGSGLPEEDNEVDEGSGKPIDEEPIPSVTAVPDSHDVTKEHATTETIEGQFVTTQEAEEEVHDEGSGLSEHTEQPTTQAQTEIVSTEKVYEGLQTTATLESDSHVKDTIIPQTVTEVGETTESLEDKQSTTQESRVTDAEAQETVQPFEPESIDEKVTEEAITGQPHDTQETTQPIEPERSTDQTELDQPHHDIIQEYEEVESEQPTETTQSLEQEQITTEKPSEKLTTTTYATQETIIPIDKVTEAVPDTQTTVKSEGEERIPETEAVPGTQTTVKTEEEEKMPETEEPVSEAEQKVTILPEEQKPTSTDEDKSVTTTEREELEIITGIPTKETERPEAMDHISETASLTPASPESETEVIETEKTSSTESEQPITDQPETHIEATESKESTNVPVTEISEICDDKSCKTKQDENTIPPVIEESCTKEGCKPLEHVPSSEICDSGTECGEKGGKLPQEAISEEKEKPTIEGCSNKEGCISAEPDKETEVSVTEEIPVSEEGCTDESSCKTVLPTESSELHTIPTTAGTEETKPGATEQPEIQKSEQPEYVEGSGEEHTGITEQTTTAGEFEPTVKPEDQTQLTIDITKEPEVESTEGKVNIDQTTVTSDIEKSVEITIAPERITSIPKEEEETSSEIPKEEEIESSQEPEITVSPISPETTVASATITSIPGVTEIQTDIDQLVTEVIDETTPKNLYEDEATTSEVRPPADVSDSQSTEGITESLEQVTQSLKDTTDSGAELTEGPGVETIAPTVTKDSEMTDDTVAHSVTTEPIISVTETQTHETIEISEEPSETETPTIEHTDIPEQESKSPEGETKVTESPEIAEEPTSTISQGSEGTQVTEQILTQQTDIPQEKYSQTPEKPEQVSSEGTPVDVSEISTETEVPVSVTEQEIAVTSESEEEHGIPGEGSCLVDGQTYKNNSHVPPINQCQTSCKCISSILQCESISCPPPPSNLQCSPMFNSPDACCPVYSCNITGVTNMPESDSHVVETTPGGEVLETGTKAVSSEEPVTSEIITEKEPSATTIPTDITTQTIVEITEASVPTITPLKETATEPVSITEGQTKQPAAETQTVVPDKHTTTPSEGTTLLAKPSEEHIPHRDEIENEIPEEYPEHCGSDGCAPVEEVPNTTTTSVTQPEEKISEPTEGLKSSEETSVAPQTTETSVPEEHTEVGVEISVSQQPQEEDETEEIITDSTPAEVSKETVTEASEESSKTPEEIAAVPEMEEAVTTSSILTETATAGLLDQVSKDSEGTTVSAGEEPVTERKGEVSETDKLAEDDLTIRPLLPETTVSIEVQPTEKLEESQQTTTPPAVPAAPVETTPTSASFTPESEYVTDTVSPLESEAHVTEPADKESEKPKYSTETPAEITDKSDIGTDKPEAFTEIPVNVTEPASKGDEHVTEVHPQVTEAADKEGIEAEYLTEVPVRTETPETETEKPELTPAEVPEVPTKENEKPVVTTELPGEVIGTTESEGEKPEVVTEVQVTEAEKTKESEKPVVTTELPGEVIGTTESEGEKPEVVTEVQVTEAEKTKESGKPVVTTEVTGEVIGTTESEGEIPEAVTEVHVTEAEKEGDEHEGITEIPAEVTEVTDKVNKTETTEKSTEKPAGVTEVFIQTTEQETQQPDSVTEIPKQAPEVGEEQNGTQTTEISENVRESESSQGVTDIPEQAPGTIEPEAITEVPEKVTEAVETESEKPEGSTETISQVTVTGEIETEKPEGITEIPVHVTEAGEKEKPESITEVELTGVTDSSDKESEKTKDITEAPITETVPESTNKDLLSPVTSEDIITQRVPVVGEQPSKSVDSETEEATSVESVTPQSETTRPESAEAEPGVTEKIVPEQPEVSSTESEKETTEIGEFPTHAPLPADTTEPEHIVPVTEVKDTTTSVPILTESEESAKSTEGLLSSKPTEEPLVTESEEVSSTEKEEQEFTSAQLTTQAPLNDTGLYTSGPLEVELSTRKYVEGELSTSVPIAPISTSSPTHAPAPGQNIPGEQVPELPDYHSQDDYDEDDQSPLGPGTCRYGGKVYVSAQQIPRDDPCDFCFCFRSDIICLQQSCPPPIPRCHEEPIRGFCCPRYECPVGMATAVNVTTSTTTTTTTLPPHFLSHAYRGRVTKSGCQIKGRAYKVGEVIPSASGPCLHCTCGGDGEMKCDPKVCSPEPMLRQMIAAAASRRRR